MAAVDSIRVLDEDFVKRIHSRNPSGHLHKGHGIVAATSSIPSKYQTIVTDNSDKKGFLAKSRRFQHDNAVNDAPGPGQYKSHETVDSASPSWSKKGTGGFASKTKRVTRYQMSSAPGPGTIALPSMMSSRKDFNQAESSMFHKPIAQPREKKSDKPGPNEYNVLNSKFGKSNNVSADAAFKSKSKREMINVDEAARVPAPGQYNVNDSLLHSNVKVPFSSFKSSTRRQMADVPPAYPGPGTYHPHEEFDPAKKQLFPRKHYLCISAPAMPLPPTPPLPGPGSYEIVDFEGPPRHYMSTSAFVSTTSRWTGSSEGRTTDLPGPAHYRPVNLVEEHRQNTVHNVSWDNISIVCREDNTFKQKVREAIEISERAPSLNRDSGVDLSPIYSGLLSRVPVQLESRDSISQ